MPGSKKQRPQSRVAPPVRGLHDFQLDGEPFLISERPYALNWETGIECAWLGYPIILALMIEMEPIPEEFRAAVARIIRDPPPQPPAQKNRPPLSEAIRAYVRAQFAILTTPKANGGGGHSDTGARRILGRQIHRSDETIRDVVEFRHAYARDLGDKGAQLSPRKRTQPR